MNSKKFLLVGIIISAVFFAYSHAQAATFNSDPQDPSTLRVSNYSRNPGCNTCWSNTVSADAGDIVSFMIYYHNTSNENAINTTLLVNVPTFAFTSQTISGSVLSTNSSSANGNVSVHLSSSQTLTFIPGSLRWYPNQSNQSQNAPFGQIGSEILSSGLNIGNIAGGWPSQGYAVFQTRVSSNSAATVPTPISAPTPTYTYGTSYVPVYVPTYPTAPVYTPPPSQPAPAPVISTPPVQQTATPRIFQRTEDEIEFEIYLDEERALAGEEDVLYARYYNSGGSAARNATLYITLPSGVEFLKFTATPALMREDNLFEYTIGPVNPGEEKIVSLNFLVETGMIPESELLFEGKLEYTGSKGTLKLIQDSTTLTIESPNQLSASAISIFGPLLNSWIRQFIFGLALGFFFCYYFFKRNKEELSFKK